MSVRYQLLSLKNQLEFSFRNTLGRLGPSLKPAGVRSQDRAVQKEFTALFNGLSWKRWLGDFSIQEDLQVADFGTRDFVFGPVIEQQLSRWGHAPTVHGIEIDAYRRLSDGRTRADYGRFFARSMRRGEYHVQDLFEWKTPLHIACLLNPFVSEWPLLRWGLPLQYLKPQSVFEHLSRLLAPHSGYLLVTAPSEDELEQATELSLQQGLTGIEETEWRPTDVSIQRRPRYARLFR